ncbi:MAG: CBS domain-containing protein [Opitutae bacterium]|nr:CBS domain-containing protein [Opitutae bacterium]MBC9888772.1 CBS domain-containing protein [Opitutae bacterium]
MNCPFCNYDNMSGAATCDDCSMDLTDLDLPRPSSAIEASIMESSLAALHPKSPVIVPPEATVAEVIRILCEQHIGCVLVGSKDKVVGIFSERDALNRLTDRYSERASLPISQFMTAHPEQLDLGAPIAFALDRMSIGSFRHLPITRYGRLEGIISTRDILRFLSESYPDLIPPKS